MVFNLQEGFDIFGNGNDDKLSAKLISRKDDTTSLWALKMLCSFKSPPPSHNEENHHKQLLVPLLMRWSKTLAHICNPRNLDLAAPTLPWCTGLLQPSTSTVLVKHLNSSNPHSPPPSPVIMLLLLQVRMYSMYCIECIWLCSVLEKSSGSKNLCSFYFHPRVMNVVYSDYIQKDSRINLWTNFMPAELLFYKSGGIHYRTT